MNLPSAPGSTEIINAAKEQFEQLAGYELEWRSWINGYVQAAIPLAVQRTEMLRLIDDMLRMFQEGKATHATEERVEAWRELRKGWTTEQPQED
jgi:hypothetical protein